MAPQTNTSRGPLYSTLAGDPEMVSLVEMFVDDLPERVQSLLDHLQASDRDGLRRIAHQLTGAAGSYGFHEITVEAATLESMLCERGPESEVAAATNMLINLCRRARARIDERRPD
ncbi:MAG TPA: Hpt domain-containing protein [Pirellulales bacterium]|jgi:HPt (histidine-containing phosphotransfer) domain-containing protein